MTEGIAQIHETASLEIEEIFHLTVISEHIRYSYHISLVSSRYYFNVLN